jgi:anti-sigma28 factor (negative regulator of flagellin synthesis)
VGNFIPRGSVAPNRSAFSGSPAFSNNFEKTEKSEKSEKYKDDSPNNGINDEAKLNSMGDDNSSKSSRLRKEEKEREIEDGRFEISERLIDLDLHSARNTPDRPTQSTKSPDFQS